MYPGAVSATGVDVFQYQDYRAFLREYYEDRKRHANLSLRGFSKRADLKSPNYLKLVMDGDRNLSPEMAERFAKACHLVGDAASYFRHLVAYNQARTDAEQGAAYDQLKRYAKFRAAHRLTLAQDRYNSRWYIPAVRELVGMQGFRDDPDWIAEHLVPPIHPSEAREALATLVEIGLIDRTAEGKLRQTHKIVAGNPQVRSVHRVRYHKQMAALGVRALDELPRDQRSISGVTLCVGKGTFAKLEEIIARYRRELLDLEQFEVAPTEVLRVNFQLFLLARVDEATSATAPVDAGSGAEAERGGG